MNHFFCGCPIGMLAVVGLLPVVLSVFYIRVGSRAHPTVIANGECIRNPDTQRVL